MGRRAGARSNRPAAVRWGYPPNSGNDSTGPRRPARTSTPPGAPAPGNATAAGTDAPPGCAGRSNSGCRSRSGSPSAITAASTAPSAAGERPVASRNAAWIARDAPALPRTSTRPGRGPTARPRATAWRMFSLWVPIRRCPGVARQHNRTSQSCSTVAPAGIGPYPSPDLVRGQRPRTVLTVADRDPPVPVRADRAHPHVTRPGHQQLRPPPDDVAVRKPQRPTLGLTHPTSPFLLRCAGFCRSSPVPPGAARGDTPSWWGERPVSLFGEPGPRPAALPVVGERVPAVQLSRPAGEGVLEPAERPATLDRDAQPVGPVGVGDGVDELGHVPVPGAGTGALHPQLSLVAVNGSLWTNYLAHIARPG